MMGRSGRILGLALPSWFALACGPDDGNGNADGSDDSTSAGDTDGTSTGSTSGTTGTDTTGTDTAGGCGDAGVCVESPPPEWSGPVVLAFADIDANEPCPGGWEAAAEAYGDLSAPDLDCGCEVPTLEGDCSLPSLQAYQDKECTKKGGNAKSMTKDQCVGNVLFFWFIISPPEPEGAACAAEPIEPDQPAAAFGTQTVACTAPGGSATCDDGVCIDPGALDASVGVCIFQEGDVECPPSFPYRYLRHRSLDDQRSCECEVDVQDAACGDSLTGWWGDPCFGNQEVIPFDKCTYAQTQSWKWEGSLTGTCDAPVAVPTGDVQPVDPLTFCCAG